MNDLRDIERLVNKANKLIKNEVTHEKKYLTVIEMARITGYHKNTLRYYHAQGLLNIVNVNDVDSIHIKYIEKLRLIRILSKDYGINLAGVRYILNMLNTIDKGMTMEDKISKYANICGMGENYVEMRRETHERKYIETHST